MDLSSIIFMTLGIAGLLFISYAWWKDPFQWTPKYTPGTIPRSEKDCKSLDTFFEGHEEIIFAGETLEEITGEKYALLQKLAQEGKKIKFFIADPALGKDNALFKVMARMRGSTDNEQLYKSLKKSAAKLQELSKNHSNVLIKVVDYMIGENFVLVDPGKRKSKARVTIDMFRSSGNDRLTFPEITRSDAMSELYLDTCDLYHELLRHSKPLMSFVKV